MDSMQALHAFWAGFGIRAYDENTVPTGAELPYITYAARQGYWGQTVALTASIWYRDMSWSSITAKAEQIGDALAHGGLFVRFDGGILWLRRGTPFAQRMSDEDPAIRRIYLNVECDFLKE